MELDYDLGACLEYNPQDGITSESITIVVAVVEGEPDGAPYSWLVAIDDRFAWIHGGCDYTGWDCQSWAESGFDDTAIGAILNLDTYMQTNGAENSAATVSLIRQWHTGQKAETWREKTNREMGVNSNQRNEP